MFEDDYLPEPSPNDLRHQLVARYGAVLSADDAEFIEDVFGPGSVARRDGRLPRLALTKRPSQRLDGVPALHLDVEPEQAPIDPWLVPTGSGRPEDTDDDRPGAAADEEMPADGLAELLDDFSDASNALAFVEDHGGDLLWDRDRVRWMSWSGIAWARFSDEEVGGLVSETATRRTIEAHERGESASFRRTLRSVARMDAMTKLAKKDARIHVGADEWNRYGWLLNTRTGVVDLKTGDCEPHQKAFRFDTCLNGGWDPEAQCPTWHAFLETTLAGDAEYIRYFQRVFGAALSGDVREAAFFLLVGPGANGKSVLLTIMQQVLGPFAINMPAATFLLPQSSTGEYALADLVGKRLATMSEVPPDGRINQALLKALTGGEKTEARNPYEKVIRFVPDATFLMAANHRPQVRDADPALWRRMRLLPFTAVIPKKKQDPELGSKLEAELDGIFMWALEGAKAWYMEGFGECAVVTDATEEYERTSDPVREFIEELCVTGEGKWANSAALYQAYKRYAGDSSISNNAFGRRLTALGYEGMKRPDGWSRLGIGLLESPF